MKKFEVEKLVSEAIIVTIIFLGLILGTKAINTGYTSISTFAFASKVPIVSSVVFVLVAIGLVFLGVSKNAKYFGYASLAAVVAILAMLIKVHFEIHSLSFSVANKSIGFPTLIMGIFALVIAVKWIMTIYKLIKK